MSARRTKAIARPMLVGLLGALWLASTSAQAQGDGVAGVSAQVGISSALRAATPRMILAGDRLYPGDRVMTGPGARARIVFDRGPTVSVGPQTKLDVTATDAEATILSLIGGTVRVESVADAHLEFKVRTPPIRR